MSVNNEGVIARPGSDQHRAAPAPGDGWTSAAATTTGGGFDFSEYWRLAQKHRFVIAAAFLAAIALGIIITLLTTPTYTATSLVQIDREAASVYNSEDRPREALIQGEEFFQTQYGLITSRSLAERVVESLGLTRSQAFLDAMNVSPPAEGSAAERRIELRNAVLNAVSNNLSVSPVRGSRLVKIEFSSPDPNLSARIANAFADNFIQSNLDRRFESSAYARQFLEERLAQTKAQLENAERGLVAYATQQQIITLTESEDEQNTQSLAANSLVAANAALAEARVDRIAAEARWREASSSPLMSVSEVLSNPTVQQLTQERARLQGEYQQKLTVYRPEFPEMQQLENQIEEIDGQLRSVATSIRDAIRSQYQIAANQENALQSRVASLTGDVLDLRDRSVEYNILRREVDTSRALYEELLEQYKEVGVTGGITTNNISIVDRAEAPSSPSSPKLIINLLAAALAGLGLGVVAAFVLEALDETLATPDDVEHKLGVSVLGVVPRLEKSEAPMMALDDVRSPFSEAYYSLRTALQFSTSDGVPSSLLVTSSRPAEGKSTTAYATALNLARIGRRVLLVDGDLRNPSMHRTLSTSNDVGMSNILAGGAAIASVVQRTSAENLSFIPCGPLPPNPAELWSGDQFKRFIQEATAMFDHVVVDGPPVLGFADAPLLASALSGTIFVIEAGGTRRRQARGALARLNTGYARLIGAVLTKFNTKAIGYGGYDYSADYTYGAGAKERTRKR